MFSLENYSDEELLNILDCNKIRDLYEMLEENKAKALYDEISNSPHTHKIPNKIVTALEIPIAEGSTYPFIFLWNFMGLVTISILPLLLCTAIIISASLLIGGFFFYSNYKDINKKETKINHALLLNDLKHDAIDLLLKRKGLSIEITDHPEFPHSKRFASIIDSVRIGATISTVLFGTYFLGIFTLFSSLIAAPVTTIIVAAVLFIAIGIYFSFEHYQKLKHEDKFRFSQECQSVLLEKKKHLYQNLSKPEKSAQLEQQINEEQTLKTKPVSSADLDEDEEPVHNVFSFKIKRATPSFFKTQPDADDPTPTVQNSMAHN